MQGQGQRMGERPDPEESRHLIPSRYAKDKKPPDPLCPNALGTRSIQVIELPLRPAFMVGVGSASGNAAFATTLVSYLGSSAKSRSQ